MDDRVSHQSRQLGWGCLFEPGKQLLMWLYSWCEVRRRGQWRSAGLRWWPGSGSTVLSLDLA